jgi:polar amino acid transport system permease protein
MLLDLTQAQWSYLFNGAGATLILSVAGILGGSLIGLPTALAAVSSRISLARLARGYIQINQAIPLPVTMFVIYFGLGILGSNVATVVAASLALALNAGAYLGDIWKGSIQSVALPQWEASASLALNYPQRMFYVILPQALRISVAPTLGFLVTLIKNTSFAVVIGMAELTYSARVVNNTTFQPFVIFSIAAALYFAMCFPLSLVSSGLERRLKGR